MIKFYCKYAWINLICNICASCSIIFFCFTLFTVFLNLCFYSIRKVPEIKLKIFKQLKIIMASLGGTR